MKIAVYAEGMPPCSYGGAEMLNENIVSILSENHDITLISRCAKVPAGNFTLYHLRNIKPNRFTKPMRMFFYIISHGRKTDVFHLTYAQGNQFFWMVFPFLSLFIKYKYVLYVVDGGLKSRLPFGFRWCMKKAFNVITPGLEISESYEKLLKRKIHTVPGTLKWNISKKRKTEVRREYGFEEDAFIILWFATLESIKRPQDLLDAFNLLDRKLIVENKVRLIFCSKGTMVDPLREKAREYGIDDVVTFTGFVNENEKPDYYKMADVYVHCSLTESTISITMMEAIVNKLPLVIADIPQFIELKEAGAALTYPSKNIEELKNKLEKIILDERLLKSLVENINSDIREKYLRSSEEFVNTLIKYYHE